MSRNVGVGMRVGENNSCCLTVPSFFTENLKSLTGLCSYQPLPAASNSASTGEMRVGRYLYVRWRSRSRLVS